MYRFCSVLLCIWGQFSKYKHPDGGEGGGWLYLEGRFNRAFLELPVWGLIFLEGLIFGILRYIAKQCNIVTNLKGTYLKKAAHFNQCHTFSNTSDFVTNSYGESWGSSCKKSWVLVQNHWVPVQKPMSPKLNFLGPLLDCEQCLIFLLHHGKMW